MSTDRSWTPEQHRKHAESIAARRAAKAAGVPWVSPSAQAVIDARIERQRLRAEKPPSKSALRMQAWRDRVNAEAAGQKKDVGDVFNLRRVQASLKNKVRSVERRNAVLTERLNRLEAHVRALESLQTDALKAKTRRKADNTFEIGSNRAKSANKQSKPRQIA